MALSLFHREPQFQPSMRVNLMPKRPKPLKRTPIIDLLPEKHGKRRHTVDFPILVTIATARRDALDRLSKSMPYDEIAKAPLSDRLTFKRKDQIVADSMRLLSISEIRQLSHPDVMGGHVYDAFNALQSVSLSIPEILAVVRHIPEILNKSPQEIVSAVSDVLSAGTSSLQDFLQQVKAKFNYVPTMLR